MITQKQYFSNNKIIKNLFNIFVKAFFKIANTFVKMFLNLNILYNNYHFFNLRGGNLWQYATYVVR